MNHHFHLLGKGAEIRVVVLFPNCTTTEIRRLEIARLSTNRNMNPCRIEGPWG